MSYFDTQIQAVEILRKTELLCPTCYERSGNRWGGSAMTPWKCKFCLGDHLAGSTAHGSVCKGCAIARGVCEWCGINPHLYQSQEAIDKFNGRRMR